jgi:hypothetical protein
VQPVGAFVGRELRWTRPSLAALAYELRHGDELVGRLRFRSSLGTLATAESGDGCWTFKRIGFLQTRVTIRTCTAEAAASAAEISTAKTAAANTPTANAAVFRNNSWTGGGTLELPDGREYRANSNFWMTKFGFTTTDGHPLVAYQQIGGLLKLSSTVEIDPGAATIPELPWLVMLGWYLAVLLLRDASM